MKRHASKRNHATLPITLAAFLCALFPAFSARAGDSPGYSMRYRPGLRNGNGEWKLDTKQLDAILKSLREKTGFVDLRFDADGFFTLGDRSNFLGGSETARQLLIATVEVKNAIELETAPSRSAVTFSRIANLISFQNLNTRQKIDVCSIQIDFHDFAHLRGDRLAMESFDLGFVLLHELGHAVMGLRDTYDEAPGDCEMMVNRIRRELGLPERQTYVARVYSANPTPSAGAVKYAELIFSRAGNPKREQFRLSWEAMRVGPVVDIASLTASKARTGKAIAASIPGQ